MLKFWYTEQGIRRCFAEVTNRVLDCVCNAYYPSMNDSIHQTRPFTVDLMIPGRNYKVHGIDRNTSVLSAADCFLAQIQNTRVKIMLQVLHRPNRLTQCCVPISNLPGLRFFVCRICIRMWHSHLNDMEIPETNRFIPKGFELGTTLS